MPATPKNQLNIYYRARLDGLRASECVLLADRLAEVVKIANPSGMTINFDLPNSAFQGPLEEARTAYPAEGEPALVNSATLTIAGQSETGPKSIIVSPSLVHGLVSLTLGPIDPAEVDPVIHLCKQALPPMFPDSDTEQQNLRAVRMACEEMAAQADAVRQSLGIVEQQASAVARLATEVEQARGTIGVQAAETAALLDSATQKEAALSALLEKAKAAHQDIEDKQIRFTGVVNNAEDFQRRIEAAEQRARTTVEEVQTKTAATLQELQSKSATTISELQSENAGLVSRLQAANDASVTEMRGQIAGQLKEHGERTAAIVTQNEALQADVKTLLQGATAGQLHLSFKERQKELERTQSWWLIGLIVNTLVVVGAGMWLIHDLASIQGTELGLIAVKVTVILPLAILDVFIATQYTHRRALVEEYAFKASICASLMPFRDLVSGQAAEASTQRFVLEAVDRIYANPSDAITRAGPAQKQISRAMKTLQEAGVLELAKGIAEKAKP